MLFTQTEYFFLLGAIILFFFTVKHHRARKLFLLAASYYFYAWWDWRFLSLILISTTVDFVVGQALKRTEEPGRRKQLLVVSLVCNLGLLGFFKYFNFFVESLAVILAPMGFHVETLRIILPVGISFYTFQTLSYTIDVYRRKLEPCNDFFDFALFVAFFPQLVAGPIVRASVFLPQLKAQQQLSWTRVLEGFRQFATGLFKKVFIADRLGVFVDAVFDGGGTFNGLTTWLAAMGFTVQVYCDFAGYSDMAIGTARALGYDFPKNFNYPLIATSVADLWRRWHISLSTWLRDYLYIPLGGSRKGPRRNYFNLMLTMTLGGFWHGAEWGRIVWGALHGIALAGQRWFSERRPERPADEAPGKLKPFLGWFATMFFFVVGLVIFRSAHMGLRYAWTLLDRMFVHTGGVPWYQPFTIFALALMALAHAIHVTPWAHWRDFPIEKWHTPIVLFLMVWLSLVFATIGFQPFIYFQF